MSRKTFDTGQRGLPHRGSARLDCEPGRASPAALIDAAEALVRDATGSTFAVTGATFHRLGQGVSAKVTGEAVCLVQSERPVWRVALADDSGIPLAEVTLTLLPAGVLADTAPPAAATIGQRRSSDAEDKRTRIARAARDVFADKGYTAATMREIAAAAGMHVPTMYQYFRAKEEILELVYSWTIDQAVEGMQAALNAPGSAIDRMDRIVRRLHDVNNRLRRGTLVMNRETRSLSRAARERVLGRYAEMVRRIGEVIAEGQADGVFGPLDPQLAAVFVDALADVRVLRPFAVRHCDHDSYAAELTAFVRGALTSGADHDPGAPGPTDRNRRQR